MFWRAARVDANHEGIVVALRAAGCQVLSLAAVGGGCPDLLVYVARKRRLLLLEVKDGQKKPSARRLRESQKQFHSHWPGAVRVVTSPQEAVFAVTRDD